MGNVKVVIDLVSRRIELDGPKSDMQALLETVRAAFPLVREVSIKDGAPESKQKVVKPHDVSAVRDLSKLSELVKGLPLKNSYHQIAALVYVNDIELKAPHLSLKELKELFIICGFKIPRSLSDQCVDANRYHKHVEPAGKGNWRIGSGGINFMRELRKGTPVMAEE